MPVQAKIDGINDKDQTRAIQIQLQITITGVVTRYDLDRVTLKVKDRGVPATCKSINDPHMTTFDGM